MKTIDQWRIYSLERHDMFDLISGSLAKHENIFILIGIYGY